MICIEVEKEFRRHCGVGNVIEEDTVRDQMMDVPKYNISVAQLFRGQLNDRWCWDVKKTTVTKLMIAGRSREHKRKMSGQNIK